MDAEGVTYETLSIAGQSVRLFRCPTYRCDLTPTSCAERFKAAQHLTDGAGIGHPAYSCKRCPIGAAHADVSSLKPKRAAECLRCGSWTHKLVRGLLCVSCFNRQQEVLKGQDRRGHQPKAVIRFWDHSPARVPGQIAAVFNIAVQVEGVGVRVYPATRPREALEMASRQYFKGEPLHLMVVNAAELGRIARYPLTHHAHKAA